MSVDYTAEVKRYDRDCDQKAIDAIKKHLGIALKSKDASLVSCSSKSELERIRDSWLKKKLGMTDDDKTLDGAIKAVCDTMKDDKRKQRVTFYYLLAKNSGKLGTLAN